MRNILVFIITCWIACLVQVAYSGTGAIPSGENIKMLKDNIIFKNTSTRIITGDSDDPQSVAKSGDEGSFYIQDGTGYWYRKTDTGSTTNWVSAVFSATGTDNCIARWNGTGVPLLEDSIWQCNYP